MQVNQSPLEWAYQHLALVGWPAIVVAAWYVRGFFQDLKHQALEVRDHVNTFATNCFPTMTASLESIDETLKRQEIRMETYLAAQAAQNRKD